MMNLKNGLSAENNRLTIAGCDCIALAAQYGTPLYIMNEQHIRLRCRELKSAMDKYCPGGRVMFASKAFMTKAMCRIAVSEGLGLDVVSGGELYTALSAGVQPNMLELHGNNKTPQEIRMAIENNIYRIIIDNFDEIDLIEKIAQEMGRKAIPVTIRLRPGIEAHTHEAVQTANLDCKFGFSIADGQAVRAACRLIESPVFDFCGIHCHIGSQIFELEPFAILTEHFVKFASDLRKRSGAVIRDFNFGGGFGAWYTEGDDPVALDGYIGIIAKTLEELCTTYGYPLPSITVEPGRCIVGEAGTTLYTVGGVKEIKNIRTYVSVDGGMFDNPRFALYGSHYTALCANKMDQPHDRQVTIAGKCCESDDLITKDAFLPQNIVAGDTVAILTTGAYNYSMASNYNRNPVPAVVLVNNGSSAIIVKRKSYEELVCDDLIPDYLDGEV